MVGRRVEDRSNNLKFSSLVALPRGPLAESILCEGGQSASAGASCGGIQADCLTSAAVPHGG